MNRLDRLTGAVTTPRCLRRGVTAVLLALLPCLTFAQALPPKIYSFEVVERIPHPRENFVQGLEIHEGRLYLGTGGHGTSWLRRYAFPSMELETEVVHDATLFGEGVTRLGNRVYQLTWRNGQVLIFEAEKLRRIGSAGIATEGWGLTSDGSQLVYSDGSHILRWLDPQTLEPVRELGVTLNGRPLARLNELEWIRGEIWANVWGSEQLVTIDPRSGVVTAIIDLRGILPASERTPETDVLNGIAWDRSNESLWVTGKRWPWLYRIELRERKPPAAP